jgi:hypothetical protein
MLQYTCCARVLFARYSQILLYTTLKCSSNRPHSNANFALCKIKHGYPHVVPQVDIPTDWFLSQIFSQILHRNEIRLRKIFAF